MNLLPYENFYIISSLAPDEVNAKLQEVVSPNSGYDVSFRGVYPAGPNTSFKGSITNKAFEFRPSIIYRNAFLPQIKGTIEAHNEGSKVHITMTLHIAVLILLFIGIGGLVIASFKLIPALLSKSHAADDIMPYIIFLFAYPFIIVGFQGESISSKTFLIELLEG